MTWPGGAGGVRSQLSASHTHSSADRLNAAGRWTSRAPAAAEGTEWDLPYKPVCWRRFWSAFRWSPTPTTPEHGAGWSRLMTLHTAKGLEFPVVFARWEDGWFPTHMRTLDVPTSCPQSALSYVGLTLARQRALRAHGHRPVVLWAADAQPGIRAFRSRFADLIDWRARAAAVVQRAVSGAARLRRAASVATAFAASNARCDCCNRAIGCTHDSRARSGRGGPPAPANRPFADATSAARVGEAMHTTRRSANS